MKNKQISVVLVGAFLLVGMSTLAAAQQTDSSDSNVTVDVSSEVSLDVRPVQLDYSGISTGTEENSSDSNFNQVEIENIGSEPIGQLWVNSSKLQSDPFGSGSSSSYDTGNFVKVSTDAVNGSDYSSLNSDIRTTSTDQKYHFVNRIEYHEDPAPTYIQTADDPSAAVSGTLSTTPTQDVGRFRMGNKEYFYVIYYDEGANAGCEGQGDEELWIGQTAHTPNQVGTTNFTDSANGDVNTHTIANSVSGTSDYGVVESVTLDGDETYNIYTYCNAGGGDTGHTQRMRFNVEPENPETGNSGDEQTSGSIGYLLDATTASNELEPGANFPLDVAVEIPLGVSSGQINSGTLTIHAREGTN